MDTFIPKTNFTKAKYHCSQMGVELVIQISIKKTLLSMLNINAMLT